MSNSYQSEIPKARVNIKLDLHVGGAQKKVELPLKLMVVGDYSNGAEQRPLAEQKGKNELALHLLGELDGAAQTITLTQWTPALLFEVKSRRLRLLRMKATRSETDKSRLQPEMDLLLSGLIALDPASSAVLCV